MSTDVRASSRAASVPGVAGTASLVGLPILRVVLVGVAALLTWLVLFAAGFPGSFPPTILFAAAAMLPVNLVSLALVRNALHREGQRARELIDFSWRRLGTDVLWGVLWLVVLWIPFVLAVMGVMFALYGADAIASFQVVFAGSDSPPPFDRVLLTVLAIVSVATFAPLNAPVEELVYRGYSQGGLVRRWPVAWAIVVPAAIFAAQHVFYAATVEAMLVYLAAFFVWGVGSGVIVLWQRRLMPIIVAHLLVNLFTSAPALVIAFLPPEAFAG